MTTDESGLVHHVGYADSLNVAISICLTYTLIFTCVRIHLRRNSFGLDDIAVIVATIAVLVHLAISYACLSAGLGKPWSMINGDIGRLDSNLVANAITFTLALYLAKVAALVFLMRIESKTNHSRLYLLLIGTYLLFGILSSIIVTAGCPSESGYYWNVAGNSNSCPGKEARWKAMTAFDIISEVVLLALPIHLVWSLQMPSKRKLMVVITFWTRLPTIALSIIRHIYTSRLAKPIPDVSLASTLVTILMAAELTYALISCTLTTSKNFTDGFSTGFGMGHIPGAADSYSLSAVGHSSGINQKNRGYKSNTATTGTKTTNSRLHVKTPSYGDESGGEGPMQLRPQQEESRTTVYSGERAYWDENGSVSSQGEPENPGLGIIRHTEYTVSHDEAPILSKFSLESV